MKPRAKLIRNLRAGEQFKVVREDGLTAIATVRRVQETSLGCCTHRRRWEVIATYPWWWPFPVVGYSTDKVEVIGIAPKQTTLNDLVDPCQR